MGRCGHSRSQVVPDGAEVGATQIPTPRVPRVNGWDRPFNIHQVAAWVLFSIFTIVTFGVLIPMLPPQEQKYAYGFTGGSALLCAISYMITMTLDPAVEELRKRKKTTEPRPTTKYTMIQRQYCSICRINIKLTSHHCTQCNKCVAGFDHHCILLNTCIGERNYWWFFTCLSSLVAWMTCAIMIDAGIMVQQWVNPSVLRMHPQYNNIHDNNTWLILLPFGNLKISTAILQTVELINLLMEVIAFCALAPVLIVHGHLIWNRMSTLKYLKEKRKKGNASSNNNKRLFDTEVLPQEREQKSRSVVCRCLRLCSTITEAFWKWKDRITGKRTPVRRLRIQASALAEFPKAPMFRIPMTAPEFDTDNPLPGSCQYVLTQERQESLPDNRDTIIKIAESAIDNALLSSSWNEPPQETQCTLREGQGVQTMPSTTIISMGELEEQQALSDESVSS